MYLEHALQNKVLLFVILKVEILNPQHKECVP